MQNTAFGQAAFTDTSDVWYESDYSDEFFRSAFSRDLPPLEEYLSLKPVDIYNALKKHVVNQEAACRQVAVMMYQHLRGHRFVSLIAGPTGSGKSFLTETLQQLFPGLVFLREVSNLTQDGWKGSKKVSSLFHGVQVPAQYNGRVFPLLVLDECDKLFAPRISAGDENVSETTQAELLSVIHGGLLEVKESGDVSSLNTRVMSFLFAGSFEKKARAIAEDESPASLGFGAVFQKPSLYARELTLNDIREAGCIPELCGRIERVINLQPFDEALFRGLLDDNRKGPVAELEKEFGIRLRISGGKKDELAQVAFSDGHGMRGMKRELRKYIDDAIWEDCDAKEITIA